MHSKRSSFECTPGAPIHSGTAPSRRLHLGGLFAVALCLAPIGSHAQQPLPPPDLYATNLNPAPAELAPALIGPVLGRFEGDITDTDGALVSGAVVTLHNLANSAEQSTAADAAGQFALSNLLPGRYALSITAPGFAPYTSAVLALAAGEVQSLHDLHLALASAHTEVTVTLSREERADDQLHSAEQQRVVGLFPNFYTSFEAEPAPLNTRQKFSLALHATLDPSAFFTAGVVAAGEQIKGTFPQYGDGTLGFGKRYGAAFADGMGGKLIGSALLPAVFRQDPRYFYLGTGGFRHRAMHALGSAVLARGDSGRWQPNYSHILGNAAAGAMATLYHPAADSAAKLALDNGLIGILGSAAVNFAREFLLKPFTRGIAPGAGAP